MMFADKNANGIVETPGEIVQENHYYPFGLGYEGPWLMNDAVARDNKYQYNGKEWNDDWGLKWNDYGARWYDAAIGRWGAVDPLMEKYAQLSPYNYTANNPVLLIDPDGREIWLPLADGNRVRYDGGNLYNSDGGRYEGNDEFATKASSVLNTIYSVDNGKKMLDALTSSDVKFNLNNTFYTDKNGNSLTDVLSYGGIKDGVANINAGPLMTLGEGQSIEVVSHELFHGFQDLNGEKGATVNREIGAYLFDRSVTMSLGHGTLGFGGEDYNNAMMNLIFSNEFSQADYDKALETFKTQSSVNSNGIYNNFKVITPDANPSIKLFFPLFK